jgi:hypothetical protein
MTDTTTIGFQDAAASLGVPLRVLRAAIRAGKIPAPPFKHATAKLPAAWLATTKEAVKASPKALVRTFQQKVPPFARYEGTSCWRKYPIRVKEYYANKAKAAA